MPTFRLNSLLEHSRLQSIEVSAGESDTMLECIGRVFPDLTRLSDHLVLELQGIRKRMIDLSEAPASIEQGSEVNIYLNIFRHQKSLQASIQCLDEGSLCFDENAGIFALQGEEIYFYNDILDKEFRFSLGKSLRPDLMFVFQGEPHFICDREILFFPLNSKTINTQTHLRTGADAIPGSGARFNVQNQCITWIMPDGQVGYWDLISGNHDRYYLLYIKRNISPRVYGYWNEDIHFSVLSHVYPDKLFIARHSRVYPLSFPFDIVNAFPLYGIGRSVEKTVVQITHWFAYGKSGEMVLFEEANQKMSNVLNRALAESLKVPHRVFPTCNGIFVVQPGRIHKFELIPGNEQK